MLREDAADNGVGRSAANGAGQEQLGHALQSRGPLEAPSLCGKTRSGEHTRLMEAKSRSAPRWSQCAMQRNTGTGTIRQRFARPLRKDDTPNQRSGIQGSSIAAVRAGHIWGLRLNPRDCLVPQARGLI